MRRVIIAILALLAASPVAAMQCGKADEIRRVLAEQYQEEPVAIGMINDKVIASVYASVGGKTWTILTFTTDGSACIVSSGKDWTGGEPPMGSGT